MKETKEDLKVGGISQSDLEKQVMPFKCQGKVNGRQVQIHRDTGADIDVVHQNYVSIEYYTGEHRWLNTPLFPEPFCCQIVDITLEIPEKVILAQAAVTASPAYEVIYLMGNETAQSLQNTNAHLLEFVNAVNIKSMLVRREIELKEQAEQEKIQNDQLSTVETETKEEDRLLEENDSHQQGEMLSLLNTTHDQIHGCSKF